MDRKELLRWGIPALGFIGYVSWGGIPLALLFALILLAVVSSFIHWHGKDRVGFFRGIRVWAVLLVLFPAIGLLLGALMTSPIFAVPAFALLAGAIWLVRWSNRHASDAQGTGLPSMGAQNLEATNALTDTIHDNNRRSGMRSALLHAQAEALALDQKNRELEQEKAALQRRVEALEREAALPPDPFADPLPPVRS